MTQPDPGDFPAAPTVPRTAFPRRFLFLLMSFLRFRHDHGVFWFWGRKRREENYILDLLRRYPGLEDRSYRELEPAALRVRFSLARGRIFNIAMIGAAIIYVFCMYYLSNPLLVFLRRFGLRLSQPVMFVLSIVLAAVTWELIRRAYIVSGIDRAVAAEYPRTFCTCGYCLTGLPSGSKCPECGK